MRRQKRLEAFYLNPCVPPPIKAREKGNIDRKTLVGAALARCICEEVHQDEWHLLYEKGKHGRGVHSEFKKPLIKIQRLYQGFGKQLIVKINDVLECDSREFYEQIGFPHYNLFNEIFFRRGSRDRTNELNSIFRTWAKDDKDTIIDVNISQLGIIPDVLIRGSFGLHAIELMRYKSGIRGNWGLARLRSYGALVSILETARFGLTQGGGIVFGHFGDIQVEKLAEEVQYSFKKILKTSYPVREHPSSYWMSMINLDSHVIIMRKMLSKKWVRIKFNLKGIKNFLMM